MRLHTCTYKTHYTHHMHTTHTRATGTDALAHIKRTCTSIHVPHTRAHSIRLLRMRPRADPWGQGLGTTLKHSPPAVLCYLAFRLHGFPMFRSTALVALGPHTGPRVSDPVTCLLRAPTGSISVGQWHCRYPCMPAGGRAVPASK